MEQEFLVTRDVLQRLGCGRDMLRSLMATGEFPAPVMLGKRKRRWRVADVQRWLDRR